MLTKGFGGFVFPLKFIIPYWPIFPTSLFVFGGFLFVASMRLPFKAAPVALFAAGLCDSVTSLMGYFANQAWYYIGLDEINISIWIVMIFTPLVLVKPKPDRTFLLFIIPAVAFSFVFEKYDANTNRILFETLVEAAYCLVTASFFGLLKRPNPDQKQAP